ncbi:hypothetical protein JCM24511_03688 [Saitozyma sp. JCM 24511]|nr:hypothetical protein JCM24511_03688 [Saitozyma sp. JCM 24511]
MPFSYKKVLIIGATSGIGRALAEAIVERSDANVVVTGRREEKLQELVDKYGNDRESSATLDVAKLETIEGFLKTITSEHPDIDFILHNAGIQRGAKFHEPDTLDLNALTTELTTNYTSVLYVLKYALSFLLSKASAKTEGSGGRGEGERNKNVVIGLMASGLAILPMTRCGPYSASKVAVHQLVYAPPGPAGEDGCENSYASSPSWSELDWHGPAELHDAKHQADITNGGNIGMRLNEFVDERWTALEAGDESIPVGMAKRAFDVIEPTRKEMYEKMDKMVAGSEQYESHRAQ